VSWACGSPASPTGSRDVERHPTGGEGAGAGAGDMVGLTSTHSTGSGTKLLERGWTLSSSGVAQGVRPQAGVGILTSPRLSAPVLEFSPVNERVASMRLQAGGKALTP